MAARQPKCHYDNVVCLPLFVLAFSLLLPQTVFCSPLSYNAAIKYFENQDGESQQSNIQNLSFDQNQELTPVLSLSESIRYSRSWTEGSGSRESLYPQIMLTANNYLVNWVLSASLNELYGDAGAASSKRSWDSLLSSRWDKPYLPALRLSLGQDANISHDSPRSVDNESFRSGMGLDWNVLIGKLSFDYSRNEDFSNISQREDSFDNYSTLFSTSRSYLQNRVNVNFSQKYNKQHSESISGTGAGSGSPILLPVLDFTTFHQNDSTPDRGELIAEAALKDDKLDVTAVSFPPGQTINLGLKVDTKRVEIIEIYTPTDVGVNFAAFRWDLYSSLDGTNWIPEARGIPSVYAEQHFEIKIPELQQKAIVYLKVVGPDPLAAPLDISEIKAAYFATTGESDNENYVTSLGVGLILSQNTSFMYNVSFETGRPSTGLNFTRQSQSANLNFGPWNSLTTRVTAGEFTQQFESSSTTMSRSYGVALSYPPIPTVDVTVGGDRSETYVDGSKQTTSQNYILGVNASLYHDLDSGFEFRYNINDNVQDQTTTDNYFTSLNFVARLSPRTTSNFSVSYSSSSGDTSTNPITANFDLNWRASDIMALQTGVVHQWVSGGADTSSFRMSYDVAPTSKTQVGLIYDWTDSSLSSTNNITVSARWNLTNYLSWSLSTGYHDSGNTYNYQFDTVLWISF